MIEASGVDSASIYEQPKLSLVISARTAEKDFESVQTAEPNRIRIRDSIKKSQQKKQSLIDLYDTHKRSPIKAP